MNSLTERLGVLRRMDGLFFAAICLLAAIGVAFIYSAYAHTEDSLLATKAGMQIIWFALGLAAFFVAMATDYERIGDVAWGLYLVAMLALVLVLVFGARINSARSWFMLGGVTVQPSEFAKLATAVALAQFLSDPMRDVRSPLILLQVLAIIGVPMGLIMLQPDFGTAMTFLPMAAVMMFVAGVPLRYFVALGALAALAAVSAWFFLLADYQKERVLVFLDPTRDLRRAGYNMYQAEIAVGSGGLRGKGYLMGTQNVLGYLPGTVAPTDFIFCVIAEEVGFVGSTGLLALFAAVTWGGTRAALRSRDKFGRLLAVGVVTLLFTHVCVNIAMTIGLMPITGIPLPLVSYGGSFMIATMAGLGLVQSVFVRRPRGA